MRTFRVTFTDGTSYKTSVSEESTPESFLAYLGQGPQVEEDQLTGKETSRFVHRVEELSQE